MKLIWIEAVRRMLRAGGEFVQEHSQNGVRRELFPIRSGGRRRSLFAFEESRTTETGASVRSLPDGGRRRSLFAFKGASPAEGTSRNRRGEPGRGRLRVCATVMLGVGCAMAGPREFGMAEFAEAAKARGTRLQIRCEVGDGAPESWRMEGARVTGGDLRGLMYGLFEAAAQMRATGWLAASQGSASVGMRGVRVNWDGAARSASIEEWREFVEMLARTRINRLHVAMAEPERHVELLSELSRLCAGYAIDFVVGFAEQSAGGAVIAERIAKLVHACPHVRTLNLRVAGNADAAFHRAWIARVAAEAGRWVNLELAGAPRGLEGSAVRIARVFGEEIFESRSEEYFEALSPLRMGAPVWADPMWTRYVAGVVQRSGAAGFEVEAPWPAQRHWAFFLAWGRVGYNTSIGDKTLSGEFERRYGKQDGANLFQAYSAASRAFTLAALLRPGRWVASEEEAARFAKEGIGSAKLTPADLSAAARAAAAEAEPAIGRLKEQQELPALVSAVRERVGTHVDDAPRKPGARPTVQHFPPRAAPANIAFPLGLVVSQAANVRTVRLHYHVAGEEGGFQTKEAPASRPWFEIKAARDLTYYFEIVSRDNKGWFYPDPLTAAPYLHLPVRERKVEPPADEPKPQP